LADDSDSDCIDIDDLFILIQHWSTDNPKCDIGPMPWGDGVVDKADLEILMSYWEQEFPNLKPVKRRGNRRYYQRKDVIMIRQIRSLLYEHGYTIGGARQKLSGEEAKEDVNRSLQIIHQLRVELEEVLDILKH